MKFRAYQATARHKAVNLTWGMLSQVMRSASSTSKRRNLSRSFPQTRSPTQARNKANPTASARHSRQVAGNHCPGCNALPRRRHQIWSDSASRLGDRTTLPPHTVTTRLNTCRHCSVAKGNKGNSATGGGGGMLDTKPNRRSSQAPRVLRRSSSIGRGSCGSAGNCQLTWVSRQP